MKETFDAIHDILIVGAGLAGMRAAVAAEFEVAPEQAAKDLEEFIAELRQRELIAEVS